MNHQLATPSELVKRAGQRFYRAARATVVILAGKIGKATGLAENQLPASH